MGLLRPTFRKHVVGIAATMAVLITPTTAAAAASAADDVTSVLRAAHFALANFGTDQGWRGDSHPRFVVDITGDHRADIVGFGDAAVYTAIATGNGGFTSVRFGIANFGFDQGWRTARHPRFVTDITGDGRADIVGVGEAGVYTARSNGDGSFGPIAFQPGSFPASTCVTIRAADINGDGRADLVCQSFRLLQVAIAQGNGNFAAPIVASTEFPPPGTINDILDFADLNRDGRADVVDIRVDLGARLTTRTASPRPNNTFPLTNPAGAILALPGLPHDQSAVPSAIADVSGDGCPDLTTFGAALYLAMGNCDGTFLNYVLASADFGFSTGWNINDHVRAFADITGDHRADIVGFKNEGVFTANALGNEFLTAAHLAVTDLGFDSGWRIADHPRVLADITGDGRADIVGFGIAGVYTAVSSGDGGFV